MDVVKAPFLGGKVVRTLKRVLGQTGFEKLQTAGLGLAWSLLNPSCTCGGSDVRRMGRLQGENGGIADRCLNAVRPLPRLNAVFVVIPLIFCLQITAADLMATWRYTWMLMSTNLLFWEGYQHPIIPPCRYCHQSPLS